MRKRLLIQTLVLAAAAVSGAACATRVVVAGPPPAVRMEVRGVAPSPAHAWVDGYWAWRGGWVWMPGRWAVPPRGRHAWVPGHWQRRGRGWVFIEGHWR
jgi:hypothetical protein